MNTPLQNARLTVYSREQIVARIASGQTAHGVADAFGASVRTVCKWAARSGLEARRLVFIDETWAKTNMTPTHGHAPGGVKG